MRVLHINCNYTGSKLHQLLIEKLDAFGIDNQVFVPVSNETVRIVDVNKNVDVCNCFTKWDRLVYKIKQSKILKSIEEYYDISKYNCIHAYTLFTDGNIAYELSKKYGIPYFVTVRNTDINDFFVYRPWLIPRAILIMLNSEKIFLLSESYTDYVMRIIPCFLKEVIRKKFEIIPNGIDDFWFENIGDSRRKIEKDNISLLYVGGIDKNKNIRTIQRAVNYLNVNGHDFSLSIVGDVVDEDEYNKIIKDNSTTYHRACSKEKLLDFYKSADIFVMISHHESFGLVYAEAMSQGLPIVYTRGQGFDGQFVEGEVGYNCSDKDYIELADKLLKIANNYDSVSKRCIENVAKFRWDSIADNYISLYKDTILQKGC